jgi:hypothetical protein
MVERKVGTVIHRQTLSPILSLFRLMPQPGSRFSEYKPGQYIALRRDDCKLTQRAVDANGQVRFFPVLDEHGNLKRGPVTHSYSISSAPFETVEQGFLEFYVILEKEETGEPGRLTESLFRIDPAGDNQLTYVDRITGDFTLEKRAEGYQSVLLVGTGTGLAPFASMIKQLRFEASQGRSVTSNTHCCIPTGPTKNWATTRNCWRLRQSRSSALFISPRSAAPRPETGAIPGWARGEPTTCFALFSRCRSRRKRCCRRRLPVRGISRGQKQHWKRPPGRCFPSMFPGTNCGTVLIPPTP